MIDDLMLFLHGVILGLILGGLILGVCLCRCKRPDANTIGSPNILVEIRNSAQQESEAAK